MGSGEIGKASTTSINDNRGQPTLAGFRLTKEGKFLFRLLQGAGGIAEIAFGIEVCVGTVVGCAAGLFIALKGFDNVISATTDRESLSKQTLVAVTGSERAGTIIDAGIDLGISAAGLALAEKLTKKGLLAEALLDSSTVAGAEVSSSQ